MSELGASKARFLDLGTVSQTDHFLIEIESIRMMSELGASKARFMDLGTISLTYRVLIKI